MWCHSSFFSWMTCQLLLFFCVQTNSFVFSSLIGSLSAGIIFLALTVTRVTKWEISLKVLKCNGVAMIVARFHVRAIFKPESFQFLFFDFWSSLTTAILSKRNLPRTLRNSSDVFVNPRKLALETCSKISCPFGKFSGIFEPFGNTPVYGNRKYRTEVS